MAGKPQTSVDWDLIERDYRVGIKTVRQIAKEHGVSHTAIAKRAEKFGWARDMKEKVQVAAEAIVATALVAKTVSTETTLTEAATIKGYSQIVADVDLQQREDLKLAIDTTRTMLQELAVLADPQFRETLEWLRDNMDKSGKDDETGREIRDRMKEAYEYIISLSGRVKMAKEIAGTYGVYGPLQRKVFGLDTEKKNDSEVDSLLLRIGKAE